MRKVITWQSASLPSDKDTHTNTQITPFHLMVSAGSYGRGGGGLLDRNKHEAGFTETAPWATQNYQP